MLTTRVTTPIFRLALDRETDQHLEIQRLLAAAAINKQFCRLLLEDPEIALKDGFQGEAFLLSSEESALVLSIRANRLADLAEQLALTFMRCPEAGSTQPPRWTEEFSTERL